MIARVSSNPELMLTNMTQEIGFIDPAVPGDTIDTDQYPVGSILTLVPYHACATAACYDNYYVHDDEGIIKEVWSPCRGW